MAKRLGWGWFGGPIPQKCFAKMNRDPERDQTVHQEGKVLYPGELGKQQNSFQKVLGKTTTKKGIIFNCGPSNLQKISENKNSSCLAAHVCVHGKYAYIYIIYMHISSYIQENPGILCLTPPPTSFPVPSVFDGFFLLNFCCQSWYCSNCSKTSGPGCFSKIPFNSWHRRGDHSGILWSLIPRIGKHFCNTT